MKKNWPHLIFFLTSLMLASILKSQSVVEIIDNSPDHDTLQTALVAAGLVDDLSGTGPFTVFAPTDAAFKILPYGALNALLLNPGGLLTELLLYHVVQDSLASADLTNGQVISTLLGKNVRVTINNEEIFINNAKITVADLPADNGIVHVVDAIIIPDVNTVLDIIENSPYHDTLSSAITAAGLTDDLSGAGPFTVFAPTDDAFKLLPEGMLDSLLAGPTGNLADFLMYHINQGKVMTSEMTDGQIIPTMLEKDVQVTRNDNGIFINDAKLVLADLEADNGVVHVIDAVLIPPVATGTVDNLKKEYDLGIDPNPAVDFIHLSGLTNVSEGTLLIINMDGKVVRSASLKNTSQSIDIRMLQKGAYFVILDAREGRFKGKLLVR
jgi:uncharacterized surface protein with fasciclin (FAS1) repeats